MSYSAVQLPDPYSLLSAIKDIIITSDEDLTVEIIIDSVSVLEEIYQPDTDGKIYIYELDRIIGNYLEGADFDVQDQSGIMKDIAINVNNTSFQIFHVLKCSSVTNIQSSNFFAGKVFLHLMKQVKRVTTWSLEYLSCVFTDDVRTVSVFITDKSLVNSSEITLFTATGNGAKTIDVSFPVIAALFPDVLPDNIIAYRVKLEKEISVFMIDRNTYLLPLEFRFKNCFDVPETLITRGTATRKGDTSFESSTIHRISTKFNIIRADKFEVFSGKIYSLNDYDRYAEMFNSEVVEINFMGKWRKIIIDSETSEIPLRTGNLPQVSFSFSFADKRDNNVITGESFARWILEYGKWEDSKMWIDSEHWIDN